MRILCDRAGACAAALQQQGFRVTRIDVGRDIANVLRSLKPDAALKLVHGRPGLDGSLQGLLELIGVPYSHSGALAAALALQDDHTKTLMHAAGVPVGCSFVAGTGGAAAGGGRELTCAVMGDRALAVAELVPTDDGYLMESAPPGRLGTWFRHRFHQMFTNWSENWRWRRIVHSDPEG